MFNKKKLDEIFGELALKAEDCKDIQEFEKISKPFTQKAINLHWEIIQNSTKIGATLLTEIIKRLELCIPKSLPYIPVLVYIQKTNQVAIGYARKGAKLTMFNDVKSRSH